MKTQNVISKLMITLTISAGLFACQTMPYQPYARDVKKKPGQMGVVALKQEHRPEDRTYAQTIMSQNCGEKPVKVTEEGEVVIGEKTKATSNQTYDGGEKSHQVGSLFGIPLTSGRAAGSDTSTEAEKVQLKEWQISYECEVSAVTKKR